MYSSFWVYQIWANYLFQRIQGLYLIQSISYDKDAVFLFFENGSNSFSLEVKFVQGEIFFFESNKTPTGHKQRGHFQFKEIDGQCVVDVGTRIFDRLIYIEFSGGQRLWFKGFGRFGNVLLGLKDEKSPESMFKLNIKADWDIDFSDWNDLLLSNLNRKVKVNLDSKIDLIYYQSNIKSISFESLVESYFDANFFDLPTLEIQRSYLYEYFSQIHQLIDFSSSQKNNKVNIDINFHSVLKNIEIEQVIENITLAATDYIRWYFFHQFKTSFIDATQKRIRQDKGLIKGYLKRKEEIVERRSYREIGDLILAHAHSIKKGVTNALLMDYYTNQRIRVKLDENLSAAENAQKYYRKAKNEFLELEKLEENIRQITNKIQENEDKLMTVMQAESFKDVKSYQKSKEQFNIPQKKANHAVPYKLYEFEGFEFWVGKNAKSNDEILRIANKNDMWLHVKDFTGSHVIIKQRGKNFPNSIVQVAAQLAAFHSKAKHQSLVQVQYTLRKFVSKAKKSVSGEVNVLQESFIDVEPKDLEIAK